MFAIVFAIRALTPVPAIAAEETPRPVATAAASAPAAAKILAAFATAWDAISAYSATISVNERLGDKQETAVLAYDFRKPTTATVHVNVGPNAGATIVWSGGTTVVAHRGSGLAALFKKTLSLHDPQVTTPRGSSIDQLSFGAILAHAQQQPGTLSAGAGDVIDGQTTDAVTLTPAPGTDDAGLTREVLELSPVTHLPVRVIGYDGDTVVRKIDFTNVTITTP